ncbi:hypothetical protein ACROYT_G042597 [Oculina patagonica]
MHSTGTMMIPMLLVAATLCSVVSSSDSENTVPQELRFQNYSEQRVKGCYNYNQTLGICFDVRRGAMKLLKTTGKAIVTYMKLGPNIFYYQVVDQGFIGHGPSLIYVPDNISRVPQVLRKFLATKQTAEESPQEIELLKSHYQEVVGELHYVPEIQLLELVSVALSDNSTQLDILKPFHALCFNLLKTSDIQTPTELRAVHDLDDETADQHGERKKRWLWPRQRSHCSLERDPNNDDCFGMCGSGCWCWSWVCDDCCHHQGCWEHDKCCDKCWFSSYCLVPFVFGFRCSGYGAYPRCMRHGFWRSWWRK